LKVSIFNEILRRIQINQEVGWIDITSEIENKSILGKLFFLSPIFQEVQIFTIP
jgi:hypothetical protein